MADRDKLKAQAPRGFADRSAADIRATEQMVARIRRVYERYGFEPGETPLVEYTESLGKFLPDLDRPNEGVFSFRDDDEQWLSLRYDLTAPLARYVAENYERLPKPYRSYRFGWVFRNEKPGPGRFRQFMQFDADTVGASSPAADAEICMMAADTLEEVGIPRGQYVIKVNSRKVLDGVMEAFAPNDKDKALSILRAIDKLDRLGVGGVFDLLGRGRKDESGDFTSGAGLSDEANTSILAVTTSSRSGGFRVVGDAVQIRPSNAFLEYIKARGAGEYGNTTFVGPEITARAASTRLLLEAQNELQTIEELVARAGYDSTRIKIDHSVVRGLEYYTGPVFEAELLAEIPNEKGQPVVFGSVGGGGRYDGLVGRFMKENVPAVGFSIGVSRLQAALSALGRLDAKAGGGPVVVLVMDKARVGDYQKMVADLRRADVAAEMYLGDSGMKAQMKYADRRDAPLAIIQGGDEKAKGVVQIKDMRVGKELAAGMADHDQYREARPGQEEVPEGKLVEAVNRMLGRGERRP
ncbi:MAG TPA: histidine--tRNA ligase [Bauldia sp.]|nr:histidine--tRNA ligase [Bauldia sp.]